MNLISYLSRSYPFSSAQEIKGRQLLSVQTTPCSSCRSYADCTILEEHPERFDSSSLSPVRRCTTAAFLDALSTIAFLQKPKRILEVGCGDWMIPRVNIKSTGALWVGVDVDWNADASAYIDGTHLPFVNGSFDAVVSSQVLEHVHDSGISPAEMVAEMARVTASGGYVVANVPIHLHGSKIFRLNLFNEMLAAFPPPLFTRLDVVFYRKYRGEFAPSRIGFDYAPGGWIADKYKYVSDEDSWKRKPIKQKLKLWWAGASKIAVETILAFTKGPFSADTENYFMKDAYVADFRAVRK